MNNNFSKYILEHGGFIKKLELPVYMSEGLGQCNPSVFIDNNKLLCNIRRVNYMFHLCLTNHWNSAYGPTNYHHPDQDLNLRTENFMCELNPNTLEVIQDTLHHIDYQPYEPKWNFVGEEDVRIVRWDDKLFVTGCRRDTETTGISRMELSEIENFKEISRTRIPAPGKNDSYCEKNWMAVLDKPYHYIKWCNPVELVKYDPEKNITETVLIKPQTYASNDQICDLRGSSQVIPVDDYYIAIVHEVNLWYNRYKERAAAYYTRFVVWDKNWDTVKLSDRFWFMNFPVEFTNGLAFDGKDFIIPFSVYDNAAFIAKLNKNALFEFIGIGNPKNTKSGFVVNNKLYEYIMNISDPTYSYIFGMDYYNNKQYSCAHAFFMRTAELSVDKPQYKKIGYDAYYMMQKCLEFVGNRTDKMLKQYNILIQSDPTRYEAFFELSRMYYGGPVNANDPTVGMGYASIAMELFKNYSPITGIQTNKDIEEEKLKFQYAICCYRCAKDYVAVPILKDLMDNGSQFIKKQVKNLGLNI